jgi:hypothetical protein
VRRLDQGIHTSQIHQILQKHIVNILISLVLRLNSEKLSFSIGVEGPWETVKREEGETIELLAGLIGLTPLLAVDGCLFFDIHILIQSIVVEF